MVVRCVNLELCRCKREPREYIANNYKFVEMHLTFINKKKFNK